MHITKFAILSAAATSKHIFTVSSSAVRVKPTHYDEAQKVCVVVLGASCCLHIRHQMFEAKFESLWRERGQSVSWSKVEEHKKKCRSHTVH